MRFWFRTYHTPLLELKNKYANKWFYVDNEPVFILNFEKITNYNSYYKHCKYTPFYFTCWKFPTSNQITYVFDEGLMFGYNWTDSLDKFNFKPVDEEKAIKFEKGRNCLLIKKEESENKKITDKKNAEIEKFEKREKEIMQQINKCCRSMK